LPAGQPLETRIRAPGRRAARFGRILEGRLMRTFSNGRRRMPKAVGLMNRARSLAFRTILGYKVRLDFEWPAIGRFLQPN